MSGAPRRPVTKGAGRVKAPRKVCRSSRCCTAPPADAVRLHSTSNRSTTPCNESRRPYRRFSSTKHHSCPSKRSTGIPTTLFCTSRCARRAQYDARAPKLTCGLSTRAVRSAGPHAVQLSGQAHHGSLGEGSEGEDCPLVPSLVFFRRCGLWERRRRTAGGRE